MVSPKLSFVGPLDSSGTATGPDLSLYLAEESHDNSETETNAENIPTFGSDETVLAPISGSRDIRYRGSTSGLRLVQAGYGSDPVEALRTWLVHLESLVQPQQGQGYRVTDDVRGKTYDPMTENPGVIVDSVRWEYESGSGAVTDWTVEGQLVKGVQAADNRQDYIDEQLASQETIDHDRIEIDGFSLDLGEVEQRSYEREIDVNQSGLLHQFDVPNVGIAETGVQGSVRLNGRISNGPSKDLGQISRQINEDLHGSQATIYDSLTERTYTGAIGESSSVFEAGSPNLVNYNIELTIGRDVQ